MRYVWRGRIKKPGDILSLVLVLATPKAGGLQRPVCRPECRFSNVDPRVGPRLQSVTCAWAALSFLCASSFTVRRGGINDVAGEVISPSLSPSLCFACTRARRPVTGRSAFERAARVQLRPRMCDLRLSATERRGVLHFNVVLKRCLRQTGNSIVPIIVVCQLYWKNALD